MNQYSYHEQNLRKNLQKCNDFLVKFIIIKQQIWIATFCAFKSFYFLHSDRISQEAFSLIMLL